jgi:lipopolysaccharide transport system ATP-binding protein
MARSTEESVENSDQLSHTNGLTETEALPEQEQETVTPTAQQVTPPQAAAVRTTSVRAKVIKFSNVSKKFTLRHERPQSFQDMVVSLFGLRSPSRLGKPMPRPATEKFWALKEVNFGIYQGEAVGIIGENGSGKSTTLKLISRILDPTSGSVSVRGKVSALLELGTGFHPELTGRENIFLNGSLLGIPRKEMADRYDAIVDFAEMREFIDTPIKHYSSGMVMRLGFAVAINVDPDILLTDEVLAVGDEAFQRKCLDYIAALRRRGVTIIYVSHALDSVRGLCSRAIWLDHGKLIADGPANDVIDQYLAFENEKHADRIREEYEARRDGTSDRYASGATHAAVEIQEPTQEDLEEQAQTGIDAGEQVEPDGQEAVGKFTYDAPGTHWTSGRAEITDVRFFNAAGEDIKTFLTDQPLTMRIYYLAHDHIDSPVFGIALYTQNGVHLNGPNTRFSGLDIPYIDGTGHVDYHIDNLPLLAGMYDVTVALTGADIAETLDHQQRAYSFYVQPTPGLAERWGLIHIPAAWSFHPDPGEDVTQAQVETREETETPTA